MPSISLHKRETGYYSGGLGNARWAFLAIVALFGIGAFAYAFRMNKRRALEGRAPIRGTAWLTPPSYRQSQNQNGQPRNGNYVPTYTENANEQDAGHYDAQGMFHPNPNKVNEGVGGPDPSLPPAAYLASSSTIVVDANGVAAPYDHGDVELDDLYRRPYGAPPIATNDIPMEGSSSGTLEYSPPPGPPPASHSNV